MLQKQAVCDIVLAVLDCMSLRLLLAVAMPKQVFLLLHLSSSGVKHTGTKGNAQHCSEQAGTQQTDKQPPAAPSPRVSTIQSDSN